MNLISHDISDEHRIRKVYITILGFKHIAKKHTFFKKIAIILVYVNYLVRCIPIQWCGKTLLHTLLCTLKHLRQKVKLLLKHEIFVKF